MEKKKPPDVPSRRKWALRVVMLCAAATVLYWFPPVRVVRLDEARRQQIDQEFQPEAFARTFFNGQLMRSLDGATDAKALLAAVRRDPKEAKARYSHTFGIGSVYYYFLRGTGRAVSVGPDAVALCLESDGSAVDVVLRTARITGGAICKGTGLIDIGEFSDTRNFNKVSAEVNRIVERDVLPPFREQVAIGSVVSFCGCAEVMDEDRDLHPLKVIPVTLEVD